MFNGNGVSVWEDEKVLEMDGVIITPHCEVLKAINLYIKND